MFNLEDTFWYHQEKSRGISCDVIDFLKFPLSMDNKRALLMDAKLDCRSSGFTRC